MSYKGKFRPKNPNKYKGNPSNIIYRSLLERRFMVYLDNNPSILKWQSEEIIIPYVSPIDNRAHRYFPDFYIKLRKTQNNKKIVEHYVVEIKPKAQLKKPVHPRRKTKKALENYKWAYETYVRNLCKNDALQKVGKSRKFKVMLLTEDSKLF